MELITFTFKGKEIPATLEMESLPHGYNVRVTLRNGLTASVPGVQYKWHFDANGRKYPPFANEELNQKVLDFKRRNK